MLSAEKLCHSSSISGPVATEKPRSAKISASSSITWLTGWTVPFGTSRAGSDRSSVSAASRASSSAASIASLRAASASATVSRSAWIAGALACRSSGAIAPSDLSSADTLPCLPRYSTRSASSAAKSAAAPIRSRACFSRSPYSVIAARL
jgi:hypothetical protein